MASKLLLLAILAICLYSTDSKMSLRAYCDSRIYGQFNRPKFYWNPKPYALGYYKRCIDHEAWVDCIIESRKTPSSKYSVENFEKKFPKRLDMVAAGIVFCDMRLHRFPGNKTNCVYNTTLCNKVPETKDECKDAHKKVVCIWGQIGKCGRELMSPILDYELGLLGGDCLKQLKIAVYPHSKTVDECLSGAAPIQIGTSLLFVLFLYSISLLTSLVSSKSNIV